MSKRSDPTLPLETLIINDWDSRCNNCGWGASPSETYHDSLLPGYSTKNVPEEGCGVEWRYVASDYNPAYVDAQGERPDLTFIGWEDRKKQ